MDCILLRFLCYPTSHFSLDNITCLNIEAEGKRKVLKHTASLIAQKMDIELIIFQL